jgi:hypothetical protein
MAANIGPRYVVSDPDALIFLNITQINYDLTQRRAINELVLDFKGAYNGTNYWQYIIYCFPLVGGTADTHKWSLKGNWYLDYSTTPNVYTHSNVGMAGGAFIKRSTDGFALTANTMTFSIPNFSFYMYVRENTTNGKYLLGYLIPAGQEIGFWSRDSSDIIVCWTANNRTNVTGVTDQRGLLQYSKTNSAQLKFYRNGVLLQAGSGDSSLIAGAWNQRGWVLNGEVAGATSSGYQGPNNLGSNSSTNTISFGMAMNSTLTYDVLSDTDQTAIYNIIQKYQTTLGRQL